MTVPTYESFDGAIYDVDDTLLDNHPPPLAPFGMHEYSRLAAIHQVGKELSIDALVKVTHEQNAQSFLNAQEHSVEGALWCLMSGLEMVDGAIDRDHPLVNKIVALKAEHHKDLLATHGFEVRGASHFVRTLGNLGIKQAIASGALRSEIAVFLEKYQLEGCFPHERIFAKGDYSNPKPYPDSFERALGSLQLPEDSAESRRRVLAFEDDPKGVQSARQAGLYVCALTTRFPREVFLDTADMVAADFEEYARILQVS